VPIREFIANNIWLVMAAVASGGYFLWPWISRGAGGGNEVGPMAAVQLINRKNAVVLDVREQGEFNGGVLHKGNCRNWDLRIFTSYPGDSARGSRQIFRLRNHECRAKSSYVLYGVLSILPDGGPVACRQIRY